MPWTLSEIHPLFVHFPIALFSTGFLFDILAQLFQREDLGQAGFWSMLIGLVSCLFTNMTGLLSFLEVRSISDLPLFSHAILIWVSISLFAILFWMRIQFQIDMRYSDLKRNIYLFSHAVVVGLLFYGAHLGAKAAERI